MIETAHDMIDTDHEIGARHLQGVGHGSNRRGGAAGQQPLGLHRPTQWCDAQQRVGKARFQPGEANACPIERAGTVGAPGCHEGANRKPRFAHCYPAERRQLRRGAGGQPAKHWGFPYDLPVVGAALRELQIARTQFIGPGWQGTGQQRQQRQCAKQQADHDGRLISTS